MLCTELEGMYYVGLNEWSYLDSEWVSELKLFDNSVHLNSDYL